jgi:hypothetical protein
MLLVAPFLLTQLTSLGIFSLNSKMVLTLITQLAPPPLHPDQRLPHLHPPLFRLHLLPQPPLRLLLLPAPHPLRFLMPLVRPLLFRLLKP